VTLETILDLTFFAAIIPLILFVALYGVQVRWSETLAGKLIFYTTCGLLGSFLVSVSVLIFDGWSVSKTGYLVRISVRAVLAAVFWACLFFFIRSNRRDRQ
jgi:hypothetical protein